MAAKWERSPVSLKMFILQQKSGTYLRQKRQDVSIHELSD